MTSRKAKKLEPLQPPVINNKINIPKFLKAKTNSQKKLMEAIEDNDIIVALGVAGVGKAQPLYSKVYTPNGYKTMGDIEIGDVVCTPDGKNAEVLSIFDHKDKNIYRIYFDNGDYVDSCDEHLWCVNYAEWNHKGDKTNNMILSTSYLVSILEKHKLKKYKKRELYIDTPKNMDFNHKPVFIPPYMMGLLLGDGCFSNKVSISTADEEIVKYISSVLDDDYHLRLYGKYDYTICKKIRSGKTINIYKDEIVRLGLLKKTSYYKFIPKEYLYNDKESRLQLLCGLIDTDGHVNRVNCEYSTSSKQLADDVVELVQSLGGVARITSRIPTYTYKGEKKKGKTSYRVYIKIDEDIVKLTRKYNNRHIRTKYPVRRFIDKIEYIGKLDCRCISISHPDHLYITDNCIITHNTSIAVSTAAKMLYDNKIEKIFITRPVVESGPSIGFLPGNQDEKLSPYLQPLYVELTNVVGNITKKEWVSEKLIEVKPLSYLRGVTIKNAVLIADEMQNAEFDQLKLLLTRIGEGSKIIITGDITQSDLPKYKQGGLDKIVKALDGVPRIAIIYMNGEDIVRHPLISTILKRLEGI